MKVEPIQTRIFKEKENLVAFIMEHVPQLADGSVLAVTSKIVALSQGRTANAASEEEKEALIRAESEWAEPTKHVLLTMKGGMLLANAGIDESNADGKIILLPVNSADVAAKLRNELKKNYRIKRLGIIITDSRIMPVRAGVVGVAIGYAGFKGLRDYRGQPDIFGRALKFTQTDIADSLATACTLVMGEGGERQPLCVVEEAPVEFTEVTDTEELRIALEDDMYRPLFRNEQIRKTKERS
ncbi:coenzyme F420-0:L-glutamate ligase [Candidatus Kaiserbacteria bacterium]|nr:coenzyme F420-0:L-glutamate ligase [Candidatus Kaiserbacteria bacterium]